MTPSYKEDRAGLREEVALEIQIELERQWKAKEGRWLDAGAIADVVLAMPGIAYALCPHQKVDGGDGWQACGICGVQAYTNESGTELTSRPL